MNRRVRRFLGWLFAAMLFAGAVAAVIALRFWARLERVVPAEGDRFRSPYYLYVPRSADGKNGALHLLVVPNNTGRIDDDPAVHERRALLRVYATKGIAKELGTLLLVPCFPRPAAHWRVYTHALDRDTFTTEVPELARLDLQLAAMIDDARARIEARTSRVASARVLISGFSANGMFAQRFALLHPERVLAVSAGSPGGWPLAPVAEWQGRELRYPIGTADVGALLGGAPELARLRDLKVLVYQGSQDTNDSVAFDDGWDPEDRATVNELFGSDLRDRFGVAQEIWRGALPGATFRLHPGVGHTRTPEMDRETIAFFEAAIASDF